MKWPVTARRRRPCSRGRWFAKVSRTWRLAPIQCHSRRASKPEWKRPLRHFTTSPSPLTPRSRSLRWPRSLPPTTRSAQFKKIVKPMKRFIVETDNDQHARLLFGLMKELKFVTNIQPVEDKLSGDDWIKPGRPATD